MPIGCGVPQGSIVGPLLYLIYVNDVYNSCNGNIVSFADDITLFMSHYDVRQIFSNANMQINNVCNGFAVINCR